MSGWAASCMRKSCNFHALGSDHKITVFSLIFTPKSRVFHAPITFFLLTPSDSHWRVKSIADALKKKIMDARFDMVVNNILQVINSEHFEPFPREQSHDAQGMQAWSINQFWKYFVKRQWETSTLRRCQLNENWEVQGCNINKSI